MNLAVDDILCSHPKKYKADGHVLIDLDFLETHAPTPRTVQIQFGSSYVVSGSQPLCERIKR